MSLQGDQKNKDKRLASKSTILGRFQICISYKKKCKDHAERDISQKNIF